MKSTAVKLTLYHTSACHLCEIAEQLLREQQRAGCDFEWQKVDISDSDILFERYGLLIPVVRHSGASELRWPFNADDLRLFLAS